MERRFLIWVLDRSRTYTVAEQRRQADLLAAVVCEDCHESYGDDEGSDVTRHFAYWLLAGLMVLLASIATLGVIWLEVIVPSPSSRMCLSWIWWLTSSSY